METGTVELRVRGIALDGPDGTPLVVLENKSSGLRLELPASPFDACAILMELEGIGSPRPLTHDLLADIFREGGLALDRVLLGPGVREGDAERAVLDYRKGPRRLEKEVRPADAIALALKLGAPIAADPRLALARRESRPDGQDGRDEARVLRMDDWRMRALGA